VTEAGPGGKRRTHAAHGELSSGAPGDGPSPAPFLVSACTWLPLPVVVQGYVPLGWSVIEWEEISRHRHEPGWLTVTDLALEFRVSEQELESWNGGHAPSWERQIALRDPLNKLNRRLEIKRHEDRLRAWRGPRSARLGAGLSDGEPVRAEHLTDFMSREGLTSKDVASATGWSSQAVRTWVEGRSRPSRRAQASLRKLLEGRTPFCASKPGVFPPPPKPTRVQLVSREEVVDLCRNLRRHSELASVLSVDISLIGRWATGTLPRLCQHALRALLDQMQAVEAGERPPPSPPRALKRRVRAVSSEVADLRVLIGTGELTVSKVAAEIGVSEKTVFAWLRGVRTPSAWNSGQIRSFLDLLTDT